MITSKISANMNAIRNTLLLLTIILISFASCDSDEPKSSFDNEGPLTVTVDANYLPSGVEGWIFTSDGKGEVREVKQFANGDVLKFDTYGKNSGITVFQIRESTVGDQDRVIADTYTNLDAVDLVLHRFTTSSTTSVGTHTAMLNNPTEPYIYASLHMIDGALDTRTNFSPGSPITIKTKVYQSPAKVIYTLNNSFGEKIKYEVDAITAGETIQLDADNFTPFDTYPMEFPADAEAALGYVYYLKKPKDYAGMVYFGVSIANFEDVDQLLVEYPNLEAPEYLTTLEWHLPDIDYQYTLAGDHFADAYKKLDATISSITAEGSNVSFTVNKEVDVVTLSCFSFNDYIAVDWKINDKRQLGNEFQIPKFPKQIQSKYANLKKIELEFNTIELEEAVGTSGYREWVEAWNSSEHFYVGVKERLRMVQHFNGPSARQRHIDLQQRDVTLPRGW